MVNLRLALAAVAVLVSGAEASRLSARAVTTSASTFSMRGANSDPLPVVLWHGMGDSCCADYSIGKLKTLIEDKLGVYVHSIATGEGPLADIWSSYFGNVNDQVAQVCTELRNTPELKNGYNAVGFSQGGQFMRAVVERCQHLGPRAHTLITLGAQHQGVANIPGCSTVPSNLTGPDAEQNGRSGCETMQALLSRGAYLPWVRDHLVQAQYFKDPQHMEQYVRLNPFLPDINNEKDDKSKQYADNLASLHKLVLYRFADDATVVPRDSAWFSVLDDRQELVDMKDTPLYKEDWIGLRRLDESGRLLLEEAPGEHMQFTMDWFERNIVWSYLAGYDDDQAAGTSSSSAEQQASA